MTDKKLSEQIQKIFEYAIHNDYDIQNIFEYIKKIGENEDERMHLYGLYIEIYLNMFIPEQNKDIKLKKSDLDLYFRGQIAKITIELYGDILDNYKY